MRAHKHTHTCRASDWVVASVPATLPLLFSGWLFGCGGSSVYLPSASLVLNLRPFLNIYFLRASLFLTSLMWLFFFSCTWPQTVLLSRMFDIVRLGWTGIVFGCGDGLSSTVLCLVPASILPIKWSVFPEADETKLPHGSSFSTTLFFFPSILTYAWGYRCYIFHLLSFRFGTVGVTHLFCRVRSEYSDHNIRTKKWKSWLRSHKVKSVSVVCCREHVYFKYPASTPEGSE